jgi:hypothetical protein
MVESIDRLSTLPRAGVWTAESDRPAESEVVGGPGCKIDPRQTNSHL